MGKHDLVWLFVLLSILDREEESRVFSTTTPQDFYGRHVVGPGRPFIFLHWAWACFYYNWLGLALNRH